MNKKNTIVQVIQVLFTFPPYSHFLRLYQNVIFLEFFLFSPPFLMTETSLQANQTTGAWTEQEIIFLKKAIFIFQGKAERIAPYFIPLKSKEDVLNKVSELDIEVKSFRQVRKNDRGTHPLFFKNYFLPQDFYRSTLKQTKFNISKNNIREVLLVLKAAACSPDFHVFRNRIQRQCQVLHRVSLPSDFQNSLDLDLSSAYLLGAEMPSHRKLFNPLPIRSKMLNDANEVFQKYLRQAFESARHPVKKTEKKIQLPSKKAKLSLVKKISDVNKNELGEDEDLTGEDKYDDDECTDTEDEADDNEKKRIVDE
ncbi:hypothetical protein HMI54_007913 [Coelomomyces lativittatus]|nr:hypothetical protein HMI54_007913 [Coelomomyces lativittatus]